MKLFLTISAIFLSSLLHAQQKLIRGRVINNATSVPLAGATVQAGNLSVTTDSLGQFSIRANVGELVTASYVGMISASVKITVATDNLSLLLNQGSVDLNTVVVTGYQTQKKADLTGAVSVVNISEIKDIPTGNAIKSIQGRVPGVFITSSGTPSGASTVRIRGIGTLGNNDPLYVVDGIPTKRGLEELNQNDIESIQVLKDASSASIYGSRAANGVIIITTKRGKKGYSRIDLNASASVEYYNTKLKTLNTQQRGEAYFRAAINDRSDPNNNQIYQFDWNNDFDNPVLNKVVLPEYIDVAQTMRPANTYWYDEIAQTSLLQSYNLSFSNGSERGSSLFSVSYFDNKGIVKETFNRKVTARANADYSFFNNRLRIGENLSASYIQNSLVPIGDVLFTALVQQPIVPVNTVDGGWGGPASGMTDRHNPVRLIQDNKQNKSHFVRLFGNAFADLEIIKNLHLRSTFGVDYNGSYQRTLRKSYVSGFLSDPSNQVATSQLIEGNWIWQNTLNYNFEIDRNRFELLAGSEQIKYLNQNFSASRQGYVLENIDYSYLDAGSANVQNGGIGSAYSLASFFGKVNYSYDNKYLLSGTLRRDGSSRFGKANRYGTFPAFSAGWRLSEETFIKQSVPVISDLKVRYGWGKNGNQEIANNAVNSLYSAIYGTSHVFDNDRGTAYDITGAGTGQLPSGFVRTQLGNDSLKWESTTQSNFGIDFGLLDNKLSGSLDYFVKKTSDILINPGYLAVIGEGGNRWLNGASMENSGWEFLLSYNTTLTKDIDVTITGNIATYRNKVTKLPDEVLTAYPGNGTDKTIIGRPINSRFGFIADGLFQTEEEVTNSPSQPGKGLGRIRFRDLNKDNIINDQDRDYIGNFNPDFTYGINFAFRYKNFDLSFFIQGVKGIDVYNDYITFTNFSSLWPGTNWGERVMDAWTPANTGSTIPALTLVNRNDEGRSSTYYVENGSYVRLRNVQLSYTLRDKWKALRFQSAQLFIQGNNLVLLKSKSFSATDPETVNYSYPIPSIGTIGINLTF